MPSPSSRPKKKPLPMSTPSTPAAPPMSGQPPEISSVRLPDAQRLSYERAEQLLSVSTALGGAVSTAQVADVIIQAALTIFQASVGLVALLSDDGATLECERIVGVSLTEAALWRSFPTASRLPLADAVRERRLVSLTSPEAHDAAYPALGEVRSRAQEGAVVAVPLLVGDRCVGGIGLISPPECHGDDEQRTFLWTLAGQCALAMERARLYDAERRARDAAQAEVAERRAIAEAMGRLAERERFLADLAERARGLTDPDAVIADAVRSVGQFLGVSRCLFADIDIEADTCAVPPEYRADDTVSSIAGVFPISAFGPYVVDEYQAGRTAVVDDVRTDPAKAPPESLAAYEAIGVRAYVAAPVTHSARLVSAIAVHSAVPRLWQSEEVALLQTVVERTWLTVEVTRQNHALAREAEERREAHERTVGILEAVTEAFFAVDADWRFTYVNHEAERLWGRPRGAFLGRPFLEVLPQMAGSFSFAQHERVMSERVPIRYETLSPVIGRWVEINIYPTADGGLSAFFRDIAERKVLEAERERLAERERNIADHLQDALQPALPEHIPGLAIASFMRPALQEAEVGGDFLDVFPLDKGLYALVIGDVSGKGLAAAQQLALIRNSLRTMLYLFRAPAQAATDLNRIVTTHDLLVGFVTAWIGVYDAATGRIVYASCGHEPPMVRHLATGAVQELGATGPPLGIDQDGAFGEETVTLLPGDTLLLYTDGVSEAGLSRSELLGAEGLARMLEALPMGLSVQAEAEALVTTVSGYTGGVFRDDVAVLLARRA